MNNLPIGFKKRWLDDKSGYWFEKKITHKFLKGLRITVEDYVGITVSCLDVDPFATNSRAYIYQCPFTTANLTKILNWLEPK